MNLSKKNKGIFLIIFPIIPLLVYFIVIYKKPYELTSYTYVSNPISVRSYADTDADGNSSISFSRENKSLTQYSYTLGNNIPYPYTGIMLYQKDSSFFDLSKYDLLEIKIRAEKGTIIPMYLFTNINDYSQWDNVYSFHHLQYILEVNSEWSVKKVYFNDYITPSWWMAKNKFKNSEFEKPDFSKVAILNIANCNVLEHEIEDTVQIESIIFKVNYIPFYIVSLIFICLYISVFLIYKKIKHFSQQV